MSWHYLQEGEEASWEGSSLDGVPDALLRLLPTHGASSSQDKEMASCQRSLFGMTSEPLTGHHGEDTSMSSAPGSLAHPSVSLESERLMSQTRTCGLTPSASFAKYDPNTCCWRTYQASFFNPTGTCTPYSDSWPRAGMTVGGIAYPRQPLAPIIKETASGLLPTITTHNYGYNQGGAEGRVGKKRYSLQSMARMNKWPTPTAHLAKETNAPSEHTRNTPTLTAQVGGKLNPQWVAWLMGWPVGWTDLEPLAMDKYRQWYASHGECSHD
jgi:hypothetical protein